jgi:DNA polymerase/3'-5' exonuclease PolX
MSTTTTRIPLADAEVLAQELLALLAPACVQLTIAGSIRRRKPDIGDIELLAEPLLATQTDLFGEVSGPPRSLLDARIERLYADDVLVPRPVGAQHQVRWGPRLKCARFRGVPCDLFIVREPACWPVLLAIRTGPAEFSKRLVTQRRKGGWLPDYLVVRDGAIWHQDGTPVPLATEAELFALLGQPWIPPEARR